MSSPSPLSHTDRLALYEEPADPPAPAASEEEDRSTPSLDAPEAPVWSWLTDGADDARDLIQPGDTARPVATWGLRGWVSGATGGLLRVAPGAAEAAHEARRSAIRDASWWRTVHVLVANKTGGAGKTTTSLVLGGTLASIRAGGVAAMEVSDASGALGKRCEGRSDGLSALLTLDPSGITPAAVGRCVRTQTSGLDVAGSSRPRAALTADGVRHAAAALGAYCEIVVMDSGNHPGSPAWCAARDLADVLVIPTLLTSVSVIDALDVLDEVATAGPAGRRLAERAVIVVSARAAAQDPKVVQRCRDQLARVQAAHPGITVLDVPLDPHLAREGEVTLAALSRQSTVAWTRVAEAVITPTLS